MAVAKIHPLKRTINKSIDYITDIEKTLLADGTRLVSSFGCATETASIEFNLTNNLAKRIKGDYTKTGGADNKAYHLIQSFAISDKEKLSPQEIHELGKQFADKFFEGRFEYVIATHIDKEHLHNHIIFNSTSFVDYKKFRSQPYKTVAKIREISDKICEENGLSVLPAKVGVGKSYKEWLINKEGKLTWKDIIKNAIDTVTPKVRTYADFIVEMNKLGVEVKDGKNIAFRCKNAEQERFIRGKRIGENYTKDEIIKRFGQEISSENAQNISPVEVVIDKKNINKTLTDGYIINIPGRDCLLYLNGQTAQEKDGNIIATLSESYYNIFSSSMGSLGKIKREEVLAAYGVIDTKIINTTSKQSDRIPLSEYLKLRQKENRTNLHKVANALAYARTENVIYSSDFAVQLKALKDQAYDTRHTLIELDKTLADIKDIGKLLVSYQKYLPIMQEYDRYKNTKFQKKKFENKYALELSSIEYIKRTLREKGVDPGNVSIDDIVNEIKNSEKVVREWEQKAKEISDRIDKLTESQQILEDLVRSDTEPNKDIIYDKKENVEL